MKTGSICAEKVEEAVLALLYLNAFKEGAQWRAWKGMPWDALDRLYEKGRIFDPKSKAKSVVLTGQGLRVARELYERTFCVASGAPNQEVQDRSRGSCVYQCKVALNDIKPPIWRRFLVESDVTLDELHKILVHKILVDVMGWTGYHLHEFEIGGISFTSPVEDEDESDLLDEGLDGREYLSLGQ